MQIWRRTYRDRHGAERKAATWTARFQAGGRKFEIATGQRDRRAALREAERLRAAVERDGPQALEKARVRALPVEALVREYEGVLLGRGVTARYVGLTSTRLRWLAEGAGSLSGLTAEHLRRRLQVLLAEGASPRTARAMAAALGDLWRVGPAEAVAAGLARTAELLGGRGIPLAAEDVLPEGLCVATEWPDGPRGSCAWTGAGGSCRRSGDCATPSKAEAGRAEGECGRSQWQAPSQRKAPNPRRRTPARPS